MAATVTGILLTGIHSARPSSGVSAGTLYSCTTHSLIYQTSDTGSTWATWANLAGTGGSGTLTTIKDEGSNLSTAVVSLDFVGAGVTATGTTAVTATINPPGCYQSILTAPVTIVNANTFYDVVSITPVAGDYLVTFEADITGTHASGSNVTAQIIHNSVVQKARNTLAPAGGGNAASLSVTVRMTANGTNTIIGQCASVRGSSDSVVVDTAAQNGTTDKCTSITAVRITSI